MLYLINFNKWNFLSSLINLGYFGHLSWCNLLNRKKSQAPIYYIRFCAKLLCALTHPLNWDADRLEHFLTSIADMRVESERPTTKASLISLIFRSCWITCRWINKYSPRWACSYCKRRINAHSLRFLKLYETPCFYAPIWMHAWPSWIVHVLLYQVWFWHHFPLMHPSEFKPTNLQKLWHPQ